MTAKLLLTLVRKDVRSLAGKVGAMTLILATVVVATMVREFDDAIGIVNVFLGFYAVAGALFVAAAIAVGERAGDTLAFARALPVSRWMIAASRIGVGLIAVYVPIFVVILIVRLWGAIGGGPDDHAGIVVSGSVALSSAAMVYLLAVAAAAHQGTELRAAAYGLGALLIWLAVIPFAVFPWLAAWMVMASPIGLLVSATGQGDMRSTIIVQVMVNIALFGLALRRYGHLTSPGQNRMEVRAAIRPVRGHGSPLRALAWKESREALPIVAIGLLVTALATSWIVFLETHEAGVELLVVIKRALIPVTYGLATLVALVVGVGTFVGELQPGLHEFWQTRPIGVRRWYWFKTLIAGAIVLGAFSLPIVVVFAVETTTSDADGLVFLACAPPLIIFTLTTAIAITCLTRHALYASILSVAALLTVISSYGTPLDAINVVKVISECREIAQQGLSFFNDPHYFLYVAWMLGLAGVSTAVGLAAVRRGWDLSRLR